MKSECDANDVNDDDDDEFDDENCGESEESN